jgi:hypothetical protein
MHRSIAIVAILSFATCVGCGGSDPSPATSPAPAYKPPVAEQTSAEPSAETAQPQQAAAEEPAGQTSSLSTAEEMPVEEKEVFGEEAATTSAPKPISTQEEKDEQKLRSEVASPADNIGPAKSSNPKRSSGKLLRGLGSSLNRALSRIASDTTSDEARPAPKLEDDPHPNGEPADEKSKE